MRVTTIVWRTRLPALRVALGELLCALALVCAAGAAAAQEVTTVRADGPPVWGERPELVEELRIGAIEGAAEYTFGDIGGVAVTDDGTTWVADRQSSTIRRFRADGGYIDEIGRRGKGPGEFQTIMGIDRLPDGGVAAWDPALGRITLLDPDGRYVRSIDARGGSIVFHKPMFRVDASGYFWVLKLSLPRDAQMRDAREWWLRYSPSGALVDSVRVPSPDIAGPRFARQRYGRGEMYGFARMTFSAISANGYPVTARNDRYLLRQRVGEGRMLDIRRGYDPVPVQRAERAAFQTIENHFSARRGIRPGAVPSTKPPFWALWIDQEARLWVARHGAGARIPETADERAARQKVENPPAEWWEPLTFDVIEPGGRLLGTLRFPNRQTDLAAARGDRVWTIEGGELGEQYVVRYRIQRR